MCSDVPTLDGAQDLSSFKVYPAEGLNLPYFNALDLSSRILIAHTQEMLELDVKVLLLSLQICR